MSISSSILGAVLCLRNAVMVEEINWTNFVGNGIEFNFNISIIAVSKPTNVRFDKLMIVMMIDDGRL